MPPLQSLRLPARSPARRLPLAVALLLGVALSAPAGAELLGSQAGFYLDLPEGFALSDGDGSTRFSFVDPAGGMELDLLSYEAARFKDVETLATDRLARLGSKGERESFRYEGREAVFAELSFELGGIARAGYAVFIGARSGERHVALLAWTSEEELEPYADFILSCLDAFSADRSALRSPGPVSQYLLPWPAPRTETRSLGFAGATIELPWSSEEAEHVTGTAGREFRVLEAYGSEGPWREAWARCYRMIYRESARRLDRLSLELGRLLPEDPTAAARSLLGWVQGFVYERNTDGIDFVDPLSAAMEGRGDCDSRAMVMAIVLERVGVDAILMLSADYSHAMAAVDVPGGGQRFPFGGREWLVAETTAKVGLGLIARDQADWGKWIGVSFGE